MKRWMVLCLAMLLIPATGGLYALAQPDAVAQAPDFWLDPDGSLVPIPRAESGIPLYRGDIPLPYMPFVTVEEMPYMPMVDIGDKTDDGADSGFFDRAVDLPIPEAFTGVTGPVQRWARLIPLQMTQ